MIIMLLIFSTGCTKVGSKCIEDTNCKSLKNTECQINGGVLSLTPLCIENKCECRCAHRDSNGTIVNGLCD